LLAELEKVKDVRLGKQQSGGKRKRSDLEGGKVKIWSRMVSLWKLPYWHKLKVNFPDGFASNISRCLNADGTKVQGMKTHVCHILLQRILKAAMRGFLDKDICEAIVELGTFFRQLCSRTLDKDVLAEMKKEIPIILVKLEENFPPAFLDVMIHLVVHLPDKALL
jgi:hypothetical protein